MRWFRRKRRCMICVEYVPATGTITTFTGFVIHLCDKHYVVMGEDLLKDRSA